jgi:hypothetical protein
MRHAGTDTLQQLKDLLVELRQRTLLKEKSPGIFYVKSIAFLHFHDDPSGIFADVKLDQQNYSRHRVSTRTEWTALLKKVDRSLATWNGGVIKVQSGM